MNLVFDAYDIGKEFGHIAQHRAEIVLFLEWAFAQGPLRRIVEIGQGRGGLTRMFCEIAGDQVIGIDQPSGDGGIGDAEAWMRNERLVRCSPVPFVGILGDSAAATTREDLAAALNGRPVDLLFIDGDHRGDAPSRDYDHYAACVRPGGIVAFHDIDSHEHPGVRATFERQRALTINGQVRDSQEFSIKHQWGGIGAIVV